MTVCADPKASTRDVLELDATGPIEAYSDEVRSDAIPGAITWHSLDATQSIETSSGTFSARTALCKS